MPDVNSPSGDGTPIGRGIQRPEDALLLRGGGRYLDDIDLPGTLAVAFLRSPHAHARIVRVDTAVARVLPGVAAVLTLPDLLPHLTAKRLPLQFPGSLPKDITPFVLAEDEVIYVGDPIAMVVAESRYLAEDAVAAIDVEYETLPAVVDCRASLDGRARVHSGRSNVIAEFRQGYGDLAAAFTGAKHRATVSLKQHRGVAHPMEGRGVVAHYDSVERRLNLWSSTQLAHELRSLLMVMLDLDENRLRVVAPDVGGGFGAKFMSYPEEVALAAASLKLGRTLKWVEDRREHFLAAIRERDEYWDMEVAFDGEGRLLGARGRMVHDQGAYTPQGVAIAFNASTAFPGPYILPAYELHVFAVSTNTPPVGSLRGAGYPQGCFAMERCIDRIADTLKLDRIEVRRRNLVPADKMPYASPLKTRSGSQIIFDSGDFSAILDAALDAVDYAGFPARQRTARDAGRYRGFGVACGVKGTGRGPYESAIIRIGPSGKISIYSGVSEMGQGIRVALAQICAAQFGVDPADIAVTAGDTATVPLGLGGFASRQTVTAGSSVHRAALRLREKVMKVASHMLEAAVEDLECADGRVEVKGVPGKGLALREIAKAVTGAPGYAIPGDFEPGLEMAENYAPKSLTYGMGCHAAEVEIDPGTGEARIVGYAVANDSGRMINPVIVEGQIVGGAVHGIGNALFESMIYDDQAQPVTMTLAEYLLVTATEIPRIGVRLLEYPSPLNPLGVKGVGESGTVPAAAAVVSAIENALAPFAVTVNHVPVSPTDLSALIHRKQS